MVWFPYTREESIEVLKGDAKNPIQNTLTNTTSAIFLAYRDQQVSAYHHSVLTIIQSHGCKDIPVGLFYAEKMAEVV